MFSSESVEICGIHAVIDIVLPKLFTNLDMNIIVTLWRIRLDFILIIHRTKKEATHVLLNAYLEHPDFPLSFCHWSASTVHQRVHPEPLVACLGVTAG